MKLLFSGKTKDVYSTDKEEELLLKFKDDVTGSDGKFDPGANTVGLSIEGAGQSGLKMTVHFFELLQRKKIATHFVNADIENSSMRVLKGKAFGKGLEVICRFKAVGSFYRRYGGICEEGQHLDGLVEFTLKDDERGDPPISKDALIQLKVLTEAEYQKIKENTISICKLIKEDLGSKNLELYDIKLEFGKDSKGNIMLIDELSGGNMRVYKNGEYLEPLRLEKEFLS